LSREICVPRERERERHRFAKMEFYVPKSVIELANGVYIIYI